MNKEQYIEKYGQEVYNKLLESSNNYYKKHKKQVTAYKKEWYKQNREQKLVYQKEWYKQNREQVLANAKEYYDSNLTCDRYGYCCDPLEQIENYELAKADNFKGWDLHHRLEIRDGYINTVKDLKLMNLYYNRPACELIYLTRSEHTRLHNVAKHAITK